MIETVLFDYSGVLTTPLHMPTENVPYDPDALFVEMAGALMSPDNNPWHELERGELSLEAYSEHVESRVTGASVLFAVGSEHNVMNNLRIRDERMAVATQLKTSGMQLGVVTNNVAEWQPYWKPRLPQGLFEVVIDSAEVGCRKPDPAIYELAMQQLGVSDPASVLFIDDFEWNVQGATAIGMAGLLCADETDLAAAVQQALAG